MIWEEADWPLEARRCVSLIDEVLFRGKHAQMSKEYIEFVRPELGLDLGHNNLIQPRLVKLLGQICKLHTDPLDCVMKLDYETNGFNSDYAHPRFVAMMLRLGDLLDIDSSRFNKGRWPPPADCRKPQSPTWKSTRQPSICWSHLKKSGFAAIAPTQKLIWKRAALSPGWKMKWTF